MLSTWGVLDNTSRLQAELIVFIVSPGNQDRHGTHDAPVTIELVFRASNDLKLFGKLSYKTLQSVQEKQSLDGNPLYAILHEPIYCQG